MTSDNTAADGSPNGPHAAGATLSVAALPHENKQAIIARQMVLFTLSWQGNPSAGRWRLALDNCAELYASMRLGSSS
ncbi:hypothetical protein [Candidatus Binatus sp.]|uniref:hypothetical protein n=1 Tax=Candidatus Binatus sp. TaxID=2811406 RepID=UPI003BC5F15A